MEVKINIGSIAGGTNAGWRRVQQAAKEDWTCPGCSVTYKPWVARCHKSDCRHIKRPNSPNKVNTET